MRIEGDWQVLYVGGMRDGERVAFPNEALAPDAVTDAGASSLYWSVGYVTSGGINTFVFVGEESTVGDLCRHGVAEDLFVGRFQPFQLVR